MMPRWRRARRGKLLENTSELRALPDRASRRISAAPRSPFVVPDERRASIGCGQGPSGWLIAADGRSGTSDRGRARSGGSEERWIAELDRKSVVEGKMVSVRVDLGGRRTLYNKKVYKTLIN